MIRFKCPNCQTKYEGDDDWIGAKVACETCAARFYIPEEGHEARLAPPKNMKTEMGEILVEPPPQAHPENKEVIRTCERQTNAQSEAPMGKILREATKKLTLCQGVMKKLTRRQIIVISIIFLTVIVLFFSLILKGGPPRNEVNSALTLRRVEVGTQMVKRAMSYGQTINHGPVDIKIKNKYTKERNGETYYFYEFSMTTRFEENKGKTVEIDYGTIVFVKQGKKWRYFYL